MASGESRVWVLSYVGRVHFGIHRLGAGEVRCGCGCGCGCLVSEEAIKDGVRVEVAPRVHATFREAANAGPPIPVAQSIVQLIKKIMSSTSS